ncbi:MAG: tetratricopeptide repeat protein [Candidatus Cohnella colombiensis]|uniref:Tetratricopeptide repeat protein n=1 Tax=Candidatus Cohnella colombiensis TaxID=3121368 RepID=A0AA95JGE7_9BACL|nr:MAG: tetratricopeptide repeat protein [Cohnella sp.]
MGKKEDRKHGEEGANNASSQSVSDNQLRECLDLGKNHFLSSRWLEAQLLFEQAIVIAPKAAEPHAWLAATYGRLIEGKSMMEKIELLPRFESEVQAALEYGPKLPLARRVNGGRLLNTPDSLGGNVREALDEFLFCIKHGVDDADIWMSLGECYAKLGNAPKAVKALLTCIERDPQHVNAIQLLQRLESESNS